MIPEGVVFWIGRAVDVGLAEDESFAGGRVKHCGGVCGCCDAGTCPEAERAACLAEDVDLRDAPEALCFDRGAALGCHGA